MVKRKKKRAVRRRARKKNIRFPVLSRRMIMAGAAVMVVCLLYFSYQIFFASNVRISTPEAKFYIHEGADVFQVANDLYEQGFIDSRINFHMVASMTGYDESVKYGLYSLHKGWNNLQLIKALKKGGQPAKAIAIDEMRFRRNIRSRLSKYLGDKKDSLSVYLKDPVLLDTMGLNEETIYCIFYLREVYVDTGITVKGFVHQLCADYGAYWNSRRTRMAKRMGFTPEEVVILASIVYAESKIVEEMPTIAGVYINRLRKNMRLQADPTVMFALGVNKNRLYNKHKRIDSPYNTFKHEGLPPGPVFTPSIHAIDAVLNYEEHDYLFFCASEDLTGRHIFAETFDEHLENAKAFQEALNKRGIR